MRHDELTDEQLLRLSPASPSAFGELYLRHERVVLQFFLRRGQGPEGAADLAAETFAVALEAAPRFRPGPTPPIAWLLGIARNVLLTSLRKGRVEDATRVRLGMQPTVLDHDILEAIGRLVSEEVLSELEVLERAAVTGRVLEDLSYVELAERLECSEQVVRQRVSRGLRRLRLMNQRGNS
jgi:RNA polymerase sigma factor (sigma-70 family)